jgi:hypothetical protein
LSEFKIIADNTIIIKINPGIAKGINLSTKYVAENTPKIDAITYKNSLILYHSPFKNASIETHISKAPISINIIGFIPHP